MKHKKLIAFLMAATMAVAPATAFASQTDLTPGADTPIEGDVNYINTTKYQVTLPTTSSMKFALDPQGLSSLDGSDATYSDADAGKIVSSTMMTATNESSVDLDLVCQFYVVDSEGTLTLVDKDGTVDDTKKEIKLTIQHDTDGTATDTAVGSWVDLVTVTSTSSTTPSEEKQNIGAAVWEFGGSSGNYTYTLKSNTGKKLNLKITGSVAKEYDWGAYTRTDDPETIELHSVFKFVDPDATPAPDPVVDDYKIKINADGTASYTFVDVPDTDTSGITAFVVDGQNRITAVTSNTPGVVYEDGTLTFTANAVTNWAKDATSIVATINGVECTFTMVNPYVLNLVAAQGATFTFPEGSAPEGNITGLVDSTGASRLTAVTSNTPGVVYEDGTLTFTQAAVTNWAIKSSYLTFTFGSQTVVLHISK